MGDGTNRITFSTDTGTATVTFTGIQETFSVTNSVSSVTLGQFDVAASPGFTFPTNVANPELPIFQFRMDAQGLFDTSGLFWAFGPGGGTTLPQQVGPFDFSLIPDIDPSPYGGLVFAAKPPVLLSNASTELTADVGLIPEPSTMVLIGTGLAAALARRRRRDKLTG
jgi:hypothetical protein